MKSYSNSSQFNKLCPTIFFSIHYWPYNKKIPIKSNVNWRKFFKFLYGISKKFFWYFYAFNSNKFTLYLLIKFFRLFTKSSTAFCHKVRRAFFKSKFYNNPKIKKKDWPFFIFIFVIFMLFFVFGLFYSRSITFFIKGNN